MAELYKCFQKEIWLVTFYPNIGSEIGKKRPAVIVSNDDVGKLQLVTVVPITNWNERYKNYPWMVKIEPEKSNGLSKTSAIDCFQVKNLSKERLVKKLGKVDETLLFEIHQTIVKTFDYRYQLIKF